MSSKKGKVDIQESSSGTDMDIEFENDDSGDNMNDGDAESLYCTGAFLARQAWRKMDSMCVWCYRWAREDCGVEED